MLVSPQPENKTTLLLAEAALAASAVAISLILPRLGSTWFARIERRFLRLARRPLLAVLCVGLSAIVLRAAILPLFPAPLPFVPNDFSFLLAADTFAHGRLANPMPAMWTHFESIDITVQPTYTSMIFPGWGLALAAAQVLFGHPWIANLFADGLMCAGICWMLQAWLPPGWALLGGFLALLRIGLFTYWINTISGGNGLLDAFSGALILGALPRLLKTARLRYGLLLALGIAMLALTRPYEGLLLCLPVAVVLARWIWKGKTRPAPAILLRRAALPLALLVAALAWLGYYDYRAFGSPTTLPYTLAREQYGVASNFAWLPPRPVPLYRHAMLRQYYAQNEFVHYQVIHSLSGYFPSVLGKVEFATIFLAGFALLPPLIMSRRVLLDRRVRLLLICAGMSLVGLATESFFIPHYLAPFTAAFYALGLQAMRHLRVWDPNPTRPSKTPAGTTMVRLIVAVCVVLAAAQILSAAPRSAMDPAQPGSQRAQIQARLQQFPGGQLVFVRYLPTHDCSDDWVYNRAGIDQAKVIWAWDMGTADNLELMHHYPNRKAWLVEPDTTPVALVPYSIPPQTLAGHPKPPASGS
ncbi:MAG TPA: hypothetical protein VGS10_18585 [Terracidiphilus sp.]|nr:hypothetical protein [Terracidiphilus sp.]